MATTNETSTAYKLEKYSGEPLKAGDLVVEFVDFTLSGGADTFTATTELRQIVDIQEIFICHNQTNASRTATIAYVEGGATATITGTASDVLRLCVIGFI